MTREEKNLSLIREFLIKETKRIIEFRKELATKYPWINEPTKTH